jgi:hypothetical protein
VGLFDINQRGCGPEVTITGYRSLSDGSYQVIDTVNVEGGRGEGSRPEVDLLTDANGFDRIDIWLKGSGAITDIEFDRLVPVYGNIASVSVNGYSDVFDTDVSHYTNGLTPSEPKPPCGCFMAEPLVA